MLRILFNDRIPLATSITIGKLLNFASTMTVDLIQSKQKFLLTDISWDAYETMLKILQNRSVRVTYDRGNLELVSPPYRHQRYKTLIGQLIDILAQEQNITLVNASSTTLKRQDLDRGLDPDGCFYIQNASAVLGKQEIDLIIDPPPDLAIDIEIGSGFLDRISIYAALGVAEVWCYDGITLKVHLLKKGDDGKYKQKLVFPTLPLPEFMQFLRQAEIADDTTLFRSFRSWIKKDFRYI